MSWVVAEQTLENLAKVMIANIRTDPLAPTPERASAETDRAADQWVRAFLQERIDFEVAEPVRGNLYARAAYAKQFAALANKSGLPWTLPMEQALEGLLIHMWHTKLRDQWMIRLSTN